MKKVLIGHKKELKKTVFFRSDMSNFNFDSIGEVYISFWLDELKENGFIKTWTAQPDSFILTNKVTRTIKEQLKTKVKIKEEFITSDMKYTTDFKIEWTDLGLSSNIVCDFHGDKKKEKYQLFHSNGISYLEAKPDSISLKKAHDPNNMTRLVRSKIKQVYDKHGIWVNLVFTNALFHDTFMPERYIYTDGMTKIRGIKYNYIKLDKFIKLKIIE